MAGCCCMFGHRKKSNKKKKRGSKTKRALSIDGGLASIKEIPGSNEHSERGPSVDHAQQHSPLHRGSVISSEGEFFDCLSELSDGFHDGQPSLKRSSSKASATEDALQNTAEEQNTLWDYLGWRTKSNTMEDVEASTAPKREERPGDMERASSSSSSLTAQTMQQSTVLSACLSMIGTANKSKGETTENNHSKKIQGKPMAGASLPRYSPAEHGEDPHECWDPADSTTFSVRSLNYMKTKTKTKCAGAFYDLIAVDVFSFDMKKSHIAKHVKLPWDPYKRTEEEREALREWGIPTLLIMNLQLPLYQATLFGNTDGEGHSLVYYGALKEGFNPRTFENRAAVTMLQNFFQNGREFNSDATRTRLKLIPRIVNVDEWAEKGPLSKPEYKLLSTYNEKPVLTRPQQAFYSGPNYLEVDVNVHGYAFLARKALGAYLSRLDEVVFENAFVIQGNRAEELPEYLLIAARVYKIKFMQKRDFSELATEVVKLKNGETDEVEADVKLAEDDGKCEEADKKLADS